MRQPPIVLDFTTVYSVFLDSLHLQLLLLYLNIYLLTQLSTKSSAKVNIKKLQSILPSSSVNSSCTYENIAEESFKSVVHHETLTAALLASISREANMSHDKASTFSLNHVRESCAEVFQQLQKLPECMDSPDIFEAYMTHAAEEFCSNLVCEAYSQATQHQNRSDSLDENAVSDFCVRDQSLPISHTAEVGAKHLEVCHQSSLIQEPFRDLITPKKNKKDGERNCLEHDQVSRPRKVPAKSLMSTHTGSPVKLLECTPGSIRQMKRFPKGKKKLEYSLNIINEKKTGRPVVHKRAAVDMCSGPSEVGGKSLCSSHPNVRSQHRYLESESIISGWQDLPASQTNSSHSFSFSKSDIFKPVGSRITMSPDARPSPVLLGKISAGMKGNQSEISSAPGTVGSNLDKKSGLHMCFNLLPVEKVASSENAISNERSASPQLPISVSLFGRNPKSTSSASEEPSQKPLGLRINSNGLFSYLEESPILSTHCKSRNTLKTLQPNFHVRCKFNQMKSSVISPHEDVCKADETMDKWKVAGIINMSGVTPNATGHNRGELSSEFETSDSPSEFSSEDSKSLNLLEFQLPIDETEEELFVTPTQRRDKVIPLEGDSFVTPVGRDMLFYPREAPQKSKKFISLNSAPKCRRSLIRKFMSMSPQCSTYLQTPPETPEEDDYILLKMESDEE
ncbi:uncharacterized protein LOC135210712 isoform X2 [Macrobrachium nipponense]|uniref:uncharacterized protein LOC135210712 isoform X2 n=1 Tax=Macrobrachium nipponense TaxID=159736 RepID=UPI0030C85F23